MIYSILKLDNDRQNGLTTFTVESDKSQTISAHSDKIHQIELG